MFPKNWPDSGGSCEFQTLSAASKKLSARTRSWWPAASRPCRRCGCCRWTCPRCWTRCLKRNTRRLLLKFAVNRKCQWPKVLKTSVAEMTTVATNSFIHSFMRSAGGNRLARSPSILNWLGSELSLLTGRMSPQVWFKPGDDVVACIKAEVDCCCTINCFNKAYWGTTTETFVCKSYEEQRNDKKPFCN